MKWNGKKRLSEMPWVTYLDDQGHEKIFDLEIEQIGSPKEFLDFVRALFTGTKFRDKYNQEIELDSKEDKINFVQALQEDEAFRRMVRAKFSLDDQKLLDQIMQTIVFIGQSDLIGD
jgi:hypothetical protein